MPFTAHFGDDLAIAERLDADQLALKIIANASSYGIFVELNVQEQARTQTVQCHGPGADPFETQLNAIEEPGRYFHPLLATLITGGARLMLALAEVLATSEGLGWAFCDTDSMALTRPDGMPQAEFRRRVGLVTSWFDRLNPYRGSAGQSALLKWEEANFRTGEGHSGPSVEPLYCYAISAKRYCLFNLDSEWRPILRKASAHGLGHLMAPYGEDSSPADIPQPAMPLREIGVERWQYKLWYRIVCAALEEHPDQVDLTDLPGLDRPAVSRYAATTPQLLGWFDRYNANRPYTEQIRPFNFLLAYQTDRLAVLEGMYDDAMAVSSERERTELAQEDWRDFREVILSAGGIRHGGDWSSQAIPRSVRRRHGLAPDVMAVTLGYPSGSDLISHLQDSCLAATRGRAQSRPSLQLPRVVAPFDKSPEAATGRCFDRETGEPVARSLLKTYRQALAQYHLHPELKFIGGGYLERGVTRRRHIVATSVECIGKEANRWEEQAYLGQDETAQIVYGQPLEASAIDLDRLRQHMWQVPVRTLAREAGLTTKTIQRVRSGEVAPRPRTVTRIKDAVQRLSRTA